MIERVAELLSRCQTASTNLPPTQLYNEGWMLRLALDWFERNRTAKHPFAFCDGARWYSEALLQPAFLPESRGDSKAESFTHADGIVGHFSVRPGERAEATLEADATQLVIIEAKLGSGLSSGVKNAPGFDQAARNVACMANMLYRAGRKPNALTQLGFYVVAPLQQIEANVFGNLVSKDSIRRKVAARAATYAGTRDAWFREAFEPLLDRVALGVISWESVVHQVQSEEYAAFYKKCIAFNPLRGAV